MYRGVEHKWGRGAALFSSILWLYGFSRVFESGNLTEEYSLLFNFLVLSYFLKVDGRSNHKLSFLIGFTLALSFFFRANNIGIQISILLALFFIKISQKKILQILKIGLISFAGILLPTVFISIYFWSKGLLGQMFNAAIIYNFYYAGKEIENASIGTGFTNIGWPSYIALLGYVFLLIQLIISKKKVQLNSIHLFLLISLPMEIMLTNISGRALPHYFILWLPSIAALGAFAYASFSDRLLPQKWTRMLHQHSSLLLKLFLPVLLIIYFVTGSFATYKNIATHFLWERDSGIEKTGVLASFIRDNTTKDQRILVWGADPGINFLAKRSSTTPYIFYPLYVKSPFTEKMGEEFYAQLLSHKPKYIIDTTRKTPDAFSLNQETRQAQQEMDIFFYEPPFQDKVLHFIDTNYQFLKTIGENDIYILVMP